MGEPAFNLPEDDRPSIRPDLPGLRALEGGGQGDGIPRGNLRSAKAADDESGAGSSGLFNSTGDNDKSVSPNGLAAAEAGIGLAADQLGKGFTSGASSKAEALKNFLWKDKKRRRTTIGGGVVGALIALAFTVMGITSGPLQSIELAQMLMKNFGGSEHNSSLRISSLFRFARSNDVGETRVGKLGSLTFAKTTTQLKDIGIEFQRNPYTGNPKSMTVDVDKLSNTYPELKGMSAADKQSFLETKFGVAPGEFKQISGLNGGRWAVNTRDYGIGATRALVKSTLSNLDNGKILTAIKSRAIADFFNTPSLWHPLKRIVANKENTVATIAERKATEEKRLKALEPPPSDTGVQAESRLKDAFKSTQGKIGGALLITGAMCLIRSTADDVVTVNRAAIAAPAAVQAAGMIAIGAQVQSGQDVDMSAVSGAVESFTDKDGNSIWTAKALSATAQPNNAQGVDITPDFKQAFSKDTTAANIKETLGGSSLGNAACSPVGQVIQLVGGAILIAAGPFSDGMTWGALLATKTAVQVVSTAGVLYMVEHQLTNLFSTSTIIPTVLSGPVGGNILAYGAREAANVEGRASGGVALDNTDSTIVDSQQQLKDTQDFQSKSALARTFDVHDYRSLISRVIETQNPNMAQNIGTMATSLLSINKWVATIASVFNPLAHAASQPYDWGFPQFGIPDSIINNPDYADPYDNADKVAAVLDLEVANNATTYIPKAKTCFGVTLSKDGGDWNAVAAGDVNPNGGDYLTANCGDTSDTTWQRIMLFIFDTRTMASTACYSGDDKACTDVGTGTVAPAPAATPPPAAAGTPTTCPAGTDAGAADGYQNGQLIKITLCTVQGQPLNVQIAAKVESMLVAGSSVGLQSGSGFRTMVEQQYLYNCYLTKSCNNGNLAAKPGYSNHQMGLAMDFHCNGPMITGGDACFNWLQQNAAQYGLKNLPSEAWHWSVDGK